MSDKETITVADVSAGPCGADDADDGTPVSVPVVELLTGRGFITGKSGSGKSNTASVVIENLLENNFPVLIVDTDGEYYGLKERFELLHAGADEECDIVVSPEHAEKLASLALEQNVPIILDVSSYLDEDDANEMVLEVTRQLFAKEKKLKKPFLMLVEECHEYIPEGGGMDETGKMLIKVGKRGRKHGLGIVGISQRPADVKKDYITQCDWLVWHRLTWNNDTKVVGRILGSEYADAIEDMNNGEAFMMTDWAEDIRRVQFHRKETFDAGATPGLDDFERPDLKSVSGDLVSDLQDISEEQERRESELADLRQELEKKQARIADLERELEEARDMSDMADQFAQALLQKADAPHRNRGRPESARVATDSEGGPSGHDYPDPTDGEQTPSPVPDARDDVRARLGDGDDGRGDGTDDVAAGGAGDDAGGTADSDDVEEVHGDDAGAEDVDGDVDDLDPEGEAVEGNDDADETETDADANADAEPRERRLADDQSELHDYEDPREHPGYGGDGPQPVRTVEDASRAADGGTAEADGERGHGIVPEAHPREEGSLTAGPSATAAEESDAVPDVADLPGSDDVANPTTDRNDRLAAFADGTELRNQETVVRGFVQAIGEFDEVTQGMLAHYARNRRATPIDAHVAAGGSGDRHFAYSRNRTLRMAGLVEHDRADYYRYALPALVETVFAGGVSGQDLADTVAAIESGAGLVE